jgi:E3 ubiquitin-protein ligase BRE1
MRDKEAVETERKNISRNLEKQAKAIERLVESEKNLTAQVVSSYLSIFSLLTIYFLLEKMDLEKEVMLCKNALDAQKERMTMLEMDSAEWKIRAEGEKKKAAEVRSFATGRLSRLFTLFRF